MSFEVVGLGRLLIAMYASKPQRTTMLRGDIRGELKKESGFRPGNGGDFYVPFWADAKQHVAGRLDLRLATAARIASNEGRERLYELLLSGFLLWWEERRRQRNVPFTVLEDHVKARFAAQGLGTVKVENTLSITVGDGRRIIYPYFCEDPSLSEEAARLGLWIMSQCIKHYAVEEMRMLDIIKSRSFSVLETPFVGDEESIFLSKYRQVLDERRSLRAEYD